MLLVFDMTARAAPPNPSRWAADRATPTMAIDLRGRRTADERL